MKHFLVEKAIEVFCSSLFNNFKVNKIELQQDDCVWETVMDNLTLPPWPFSVSYVMIKNGFIIDRFER